MDATVELRQALPAACSCSASRRRSAAAQTGGTLQGTVLDDQGLPLPGATVTLTQPRNRLDAERRHRHAGTLPRARAAARRLRDQGRARRLHHRRARTRAADARPGAHVNMTMKVATLQETVTVTAAVPLVETTQQHARARPSAASSSMRCRCPDARSPRLRRPRPGVTGVGGGGVNAGGQLNRNNSYRIDGVSNDNNVLASPRGGLSMEAVREYIVIANQFSAEYGDASGAIVSVVTRSGHQPAAGPRLPVPPRRIARRAGSVLEGAGLGPGAVQPAARSAASSAARSRRDRMHYFGTYEGVRLDQTGDHHLAARASPISARCRTRRRATSSSSAPTTASPRTTRCSCATASTSRSKRTTASAA